MALAKGARMQGATHHRGRRRSPACSRSAARVTGVDTAHGDIEAEYVVNCAGMWARQLGAQSGVNIPLQAAEHYYLITETIPGLGRALPVLEDPALATATSARRCGGLMIGLFEPVCAPWKVEGVPEDFSFGELPPDWDRMGPYVETAMQRVPDLAWSRRARSSSAARRASRRTCSRSSARRPSSRTTSSPPGSTRSASSPAAGSAACWRTGSSTGARRRRHRLQHRPPAHATRRTRSTAARAPSSRSAWSTSATTRRARCRPRAAPRRSAFHDRLAARGAYFRDVSGWEGADWYAPPGIDADGRAAVVGPAELVPVLGGRAPAPRARA